MLIAGIVIILILLLGLSLYNGLIRKRNAVDNAFHSIDVMLRKRYDLIPMLVDTVKGYMTHEKEVLTRLTELRQAVIAVPMAMNQRVETDNSMMQLFSGVMVSAENYPELKASENFLRLQGAINETEEQLAASRRFFNAAVNDYHDAIGTFPSAIVAGMMKLKRISYFTIDDDKKKDLI